MKKVYVGMSGGVDSSVSALLLKKQGYDVTGVFIKVWQPDFLPCTWREDRLDAMRICAKIGIDFKTLDLEDVYKREVVDYLIREYSLGNTPNPDVFCNKEVKFGAFYKYAMREGADFVATGHYAQTKIIDGKTYLEEAVDKSKDQSYFLWTLSGEILTHTLFPVGGLLKKDVRKIAEENDLITASKPDSQGLCFISQFDMKEFLLKFIPYKPGDVQDEDGESIGRHDGVAVYTIGERHGFSINKKSSDDKPYYIISKNLEENILIVSTNPVSNSESSRDLVITDLNMVGNVDAGVECDAVLRYHGEKIPAKIIEVVDTHIKIRLSKPALITNGQSTVLYKNNVVIAGGIVSNNALQF